MRVRESEGESGANVANLLCPQKQCRAVIVCALSEGCSAKSPVPYCRMICKDDRVASCTRVRQVVKETWINLRRPFVYCCAWGLKVLVLGVRDVPEAKRGQHETLGADDIIVAFCRSPLPDRVTLAEVADKEGLDFDSLMERFKELPEFGVKFLAAVEEHLRTQNIAMPDSVLKEAGNLAKAYRAYEADISLYNGLRRMPSVSKKGFDGVIVDLVSQEQEQDCLPLHRIIISKLDGPEGDRGIPIFGFAVSGPQASESLRKMLDTPRVKQASTVVAQAVLEHQNSKRFFEHIEQGNLLEQNKPRFFARVQLFRACEVEPSESLRDNVLFDVCLRLHIAAKTAPWRLLRVLEGESGLDVKGRWREFCKLLGRFADKELHVMMFGDLKTEWSVVFADMQKAVEAIPAETYAEDPAFYLPRVRGVLELLEQFSVLSPVSPRFLAVDRRWEMLEQELRRVGEAYSSEVQRELIPRKLAQSSYSSDAIKEALAVNSEDALGVLLKAIAAGVISLSDKSGRGRAAVRAVFDWYNKSPREKDLPEVRARLFEAVAPRSERLTVNLLSAAAAAIAAGVTMGIAPVAPMLGSLRSGAHKRFQERITKQKGQTANA